MNDILNKIYRDLSNPGGLGSIHTIYQAGRKRIKNLSRDDVKAFLQGKRTYTLHKPTLKRFPRRKILAPKPRVIVTCDLGDFSTLQKYNKGVKYIMFCLDVFSRYLQVATLTSKSSHSSLKALKSIIESTQFKGVSRIFTDLGTEFYNREIKEYLASNGMSLYSNHSRETKASLAERVIKTIKVKLFKHMTENNTLTYIDVLPTIIDTYNRTPHRGLGGEQSPQQVHRLRSLHEFRKQFRRMYLNQPSTKKPISSDLAVGDIVRLQGASRTQLKFHKGYKINNTEELFKIRRIDRSQKIPTYHLVDLAGEEVEGGFYQQELIKSSLLNQYQVDVIRSKVVRGKRMYLVHWRGYPDKFDSWIDVKDLNRYE